MPAYGTEAPTFIQQYGHILWPILGVLGVLVLVIGGYAIWRGPHRAFIPPSIKARFRRNVVDEESNSSSPELDKRFTAMGRVPSPVSFDRRIVRESKMMSARESRISVGGGGAITQADAFKREVEAAARRSRVMEQGMTQGEAANRSRRSIQAQVLAERIRLETSPISDGSSTLLGSPMSFDEKEEIMYDQQNQARLPSPPMIQFQNGSSPTFILPRRRSSITSSTPSPVILPTTSIPNYPSPPPLAATSPTLDPATGLPPRRSSIIPQQYQPAPSRSREVRASKEVRTSKAYVSTSIPGYRSQMQSGEESDVW